MNIIDAKTCDVCCPTGRGQTYHVMDRCLRCATYLDRTVSEDDYLRFLDAAGDIILRLGT